MRLASYPFVVCGDIGDNLEKIKKAILKAYENKADLIIFPECALTGYPPRDIAGLDSINVNVVFGTIQEFQKLADELDIHIIVGTIDYADSKYYNRAYLMSPNETKRWYDKQALYGSDKKG